MIDPAPFNYPMTAPGAIDVYHYTDYTHNHLAEGSAYNVRLTKQQVKEAANESLRQRARALRGSNSDSGRSNMRGGTSGMGTGGNGSGSGGGTGSGSGSGNGTGSGADSGTGSGGSPR